MLQPEYRPLYKNVKVRKSYFQGQTHWSNSFGSMDKSTWVCCFISIRFKSIIKKRTTWNGSILWFETTRTRHNYIKSDYKWMFLWITGNELENFEQNLSYQSVEISDHFFKPFIAMNITDEYVSFVDIRSRVHFPSINLVKADQLHFFDRTWTQPWVNQSDQ